MSKNSKKKTKKKQTESKPMSMKKFLIAVFALLLAGGLLFTSVYSFFL